MNERQEKLVYFLKEIETFKNIARKTYVSSLRHESDAEHAWHLAMFLILFEKDLPSGLDKEKMLKMALMHDLVEVYAGDTFAFDEEGKKDKHAREKKAAEDLFGLLPEDMQKQFHDLFNEFEAKETKESKIVQSFDKLQPIIQNLCTEGKTWKENEIGYEQIDNYKRNLMTHEPSIFSLYETLMEEVYDRELA